MKRVAGAAVLATTVACAYVRVEGLDRPDGGGSGSASPTAADAGGGMPTPRADAGASAPAGGLILRAARFVDGFDDSVWQCNGTTCLKGRIAP